MKHIVIIGGGISGLATAYFLKENGFDLKVDKLTILEAKDRLGGNIRTIKDEEYLIEAGPDSFLSEKPWAMMLCKKLGLEESLLPTDSRFQKTYIYSGNKLHSMPEGLILMVPTKVVPFMMSSLISIPGKIRAGLEIFIPKKKTKDDESFASFVRRRLGKEMLDKVAEPFIAGVHGGNPEAMSIKSSFPKFVQMEEENGSLIMGMIKRMANFRKMIEEKKKQAEKASKGGKKTAPTTMFMSLKQGISKLVETLTQKIEGTEILLNTKVESINKKDKYEIKLDNGEVIEADHVIVATPAYIASDLVKDIDTDLSEKLLKIPYTSTSTVSLAFNKSQIKCSLDAFGFVVPKKEGTSIIGSTWTSLKWKGRAPDDKLLLRSFIGGSGREKFVEETEEEIKERAMCDLRRVMGIEGEPLKSWVFKYKNAMPQYTIGHEERVNGIFARLLSLQGLYLTGSAYHGVGMADTCREAETTAKKVMENI